MSIQQPLSDPFPGSLTPIDLNDTMSEWVSGSPAVLIDSEVVNDPTSS